MHTASDTDFPPALRTRIAPTPSGFLHIGNALSFVFTRLLTDLCGGVLCLRIDDLDQGRFRQAYLEDIFLELEWLGIPVDEGPSGVDDFIENYSQVHRFPRYQQFLDLLRENELLFACKCSRKTYAMLEGRSCACRDDALTFGKGTVWRWRDTDEKIRFGDIDSTVHNVDLRDDIGHIVMRKKDGNPAYQIASLIDDTDMGINFIVRGSDLIASTAFQLHLADSLGLHKFTTCKFMHHGLVLDGDQKMSKSAGSSSLLHMRENGFSAGDFYTCFCSMTGHSATKITRYSELLDSLNGNVDLLLRMMRSVH